MVITTLEEEAAVIVVAVEVDSEVVEEATTADRKNPVPLYVLFLILEIGEFNNSCKD